MRNGISSCISHVVAATNCADSEQSGTVLVPARHFLRSNLGNASNHSTKNLPVLLAGGGFRHGLHLAFDLDNPPPLSNLFVTMLQHLGIETGAFGSSTGTLRELA